MHTLVWMHRGQCAWLRIYCVVVVCYTWAGPEERVPRGEGPGAAAAEWRYEDSYWYEPGPVQVRCTQSSSWSLPRINKGWLVGWLVCWMVGWLFGWFVGWLLGWLGMWVCGWLPDWLVGWVTGCLIGWLAGWLVGWVVCQRDCTKTTELLPISEENCVILLNTIISII